MGAAVAVIEYLFEGRECLRRVECSPDDTAETLKTHLSTFSPGATFLSARVGSWGKESGGIRTAQISQWWIHRSHRVFDGRFERTEGLLFAVCENAPLVAQGDSEGSAFDHMHELVDLYLEQTEEPMAIGTDQ